MLIYFIGFRIGFEQTLYIVYEGNSSFGFQFLRVCVRMYEPSEDTPLGPLTTLDYGVETVQGSAGIVCEMHTRRILHCCMSVASCLIHR